MKKILVTGANGQLGNEMRLLAEEHTNLSIFLRMWQSWTSAMRRR